MDAAGAEAEQAITSMNKTHIKRLQKLIAFLKELEPEQFNFGEVTNECGTVCCAMGWTPRIFPKLVRLDGYKVVPRSSDFGFGTYSGAAQFLFGMSQITARDLFCPSKQEYVHGELPDCNEFATPKQVARMLEKFIKLVEQGKIEGCKLSGEEPRRSLGKGNK